MGIMVKFQNPSGQTIGHAVGQNEGTAIGFEADTLKALRLTSTKLQNAQLIIVETGEKFEIKSQDLKVMETDGYLAVQTVAGRQPQMSGPEYQEEQEENQA